MEKEKHYQELAKQISALVEGETDSISVMANVSAAIHEAMGFFWTGFYIVKGDELRLGPFQGSVACMHIPYGRGVCGTSWQRKATIVVPDVEEFPGHIACSSLSRSEIVVPVFDANGNVTAVLDIDSRELNTFDEVDQRWLEEIVSKLSVYSFPQAEVRIGFDSFLHLVIKRREKIQASRFLYLVNSNQIVLQIMVNLFVREDKP